MIGITSYYCVILKMEILHDAVKIIQNGVFVFLLKKEQKSVYIWKIQRSCFFLKNKWVVFFERKQVFLNPADFLKLFGKVCISVPIKSVISIKQRWWELKQRPLAQQEWTLTHSTRFTVLLMTQTQHMDKPGYCLNGNKIDTTFVFHVANTNGIQLLFIVKTL